MKLFLIGWAQIRPEVVDVARGLISQGHTISYWTRMKSLFTFDYAEFPGTVFHDYDDAKQALPAIGIDADKFPPLGREQIEAFYETESEVMTMMNKQFDEWTVTRRKAVYYAMLRYWLGVFDMFSPDAVIFEEVPHAAYDFIIYDIARKRGIKTIMFENVLEYDRMLMYRNYKQGSPTLDAIDFSSRTKRYGLSDLTARTAAYYQSQRKQNESPSYMGTMAREHSGVRMWIKKKWKGVKKFYKDGTLLERSVRFLVKLFQTDPISDYKRLEKIPDLDRKFVYVPLHFQPERTTSPQGGVFVDQLLAVTLLSATLPKDWVLYVKEHPTQWLVNGPRYTSYRYKGFCEALAALPNVILVPTTTSTFKLIAKSEAVAAITGTACFEAVLRGRPAIFFGYPWFQQCPGMFRVTDEASSRKALHSIENGYNVNQALVIDYLACLEKASFEGYFLDSSKVVTELTPEQSMKNILSAVTRELG